MWGCESNSRMPLRIDGEDHYRCPRRPIYEDPESFSELFFLWGGYNKGFLPEPGGIYSQPAVLVEHFKTIEGALVMCQRERDRREKVKQTRVRTRNATSAR